MNLMKFVQLPSIAFARANIFHRDASVTAKGYQMKHFLVVASGVSLLLGTPALAQPPSEKPLTTVVHFSDLDLTHEEGVRVLLRRLQQAARVVCSPAPDARDLKRLSLYESCLKESMDRAVADVHAPLVGSLHRETAQRNT